MRILLWHGYLLRGSGSNLYTANLARVWRAQGHDVLLMCQEQRAEGLDYIDSAGDFDHFNQSFELQATGVAPASGTVRLVRPQIGGLLPVYVGDNFSGEIKLFVDLSETELGRYIETNVGALVTAIEQHRPDAIVTGHEVMGPYIALKACGETGTHYVAKLHGSALEYAVKRQERYQHYAREGLNGAAAVTGGSRYMIEEANSVVPGPWRDRAVVLNPGCDIDLFQPRPDPQSRPPRAAFVGKLIPAKGVHHLLAALGLTSLPELQVTVVGDGPFAASLRKLWAALKAGDASAAGALLDASDPSLEHLCGWLERTTLDDTYKSRAAAVEVNFAGHLDHGPLSAVLPDFDVLVVPSIVPEAFGMVAAEAAACGVLPLVPAHSGIGEAGATLESELGRPGLLSFGPAEPVEGIANALERVLGLPLEERRDLNKRAVAVARQRWSWERVAGELLKLAAPDSARPPQ
ncbi:MAG: glycosyltransferase [Actinomycetota bacterium]|nr:glycosyltransferase [Actinomycetota bacterium]